jgi:serine/threonine protein kinase
MTCDELRECLLDYVEGTLPADQGREIRAHSAACAACAERLRSTKNLLGDLSAARSVDNSSATVAFSASSAALQKLSILGDFEIQEELGRGGMGVVYRARQLSLNRIVALKVLSGAGLQNERAIARFQKEAQAAARLHHTNIVPIYAQGHEQGCFFYAMELIDGRSLDRVLQDSDAFVRRPHASGLAVTSGASSGGSVGQSTVRGGHRAAARDFKRIARLLAEVSDALQHAHDQGVVHRDIKPQNLLLGGDDRLHITDFGLARILDEPGLTLTTEIVGTPAYMSPEQLRSGTRIDARADIYALGVTLYEMLTHERPFRAETYERLIEQVLRKEPRPPRKVESDIPIDLETICVRAIEKEPARRFASAGEMARDLRRYAEDFPIASRRIGPLGRTARWLRRNPMLATAIGSLAIIAVLVPMLALVVNANANSRRETALDKLLEDYTSARNVQEASAILGWVRYFGGDRSKAELVGAFFDIAQQNHERAYGVLKERVKRDPTDADAQFLLAWACERLAQGGGPRYWAELRDAVDAGEKHKEKVSGEGAFFRGLATMQYDPIKAVESFRQARDRRQNFTQAVIHQARASNQALYCLRDDAYYTRSVDALNLICDELMPGSAFPRYLLAVAHRLRGEILLERESPTDADRIAAAQYFDKCLAEALRTQRIDPTYPKGYVAVAEYHESLAAFERPQEHFRAAREALAEMESHCAKETLDRPRVRWERFSYAMRYAFVLGDFPAAEAARRALYNEESGYDPDDPGQAAEACLFEALIAVSDNRRNETKKLLDEARPKVGNIADARLTLLAAYRLVGSDPGVGLAADSIDFETQLPIGWTSSWARCLVEYANGRMSFSDLTREADAGDPSPTHPIRRMAAAHFYHGVALLTSGDRAGAERAFFECWHTRDFEGYCFRGKLLCLRMQLDRGWPAWIAARAE